MNFNKLLIVFTALLFLPYSMQAAEIEDGSIAVNYGVTGFPTTIFVDSERQIFKSWQGEIKSEQLKKILDTLVRIK